MAKYLMAQLDNNLFRLRVELADEVAQFTFLYFEKKYKILTYAFLPIESRESQLFKTVGGWTEVGRERAKPIIELGMQKYQEMMQNFEAEPNY
jgi:hypothetical protein